MATPRGTGLCIVVVLTLAAGGAACQAASPTVIYDFGMTSTDAANPSNGLIFDSAGNLYGPTSAGGTATFGALFQLTPPAAGGSTWTESVIHAFPSGTDDGVRPMGRLLLGTDGDLYGTTNGGGGSTGDGTVFQLAPPAAGGMWTLTTLYVFPQNKIGIGGAPVAGVLMDNAGAIYGTTPEQGATKPSNVVPGMVYRLTPPASGQTGWSYSTLYSFPVQKGHTTSPVSALVADPAGNLYGTLQLESTGTSTAQGAIYELTPPAAAGGAWGETTVLKLPSGDGNPVGDLAIDADGALYGATRGGTAGGIVFRATPPASGGAGWMLSVLYAFSTASGAGPAGGVAIGSGGTLYGNAGGGKGKTAAGLLYELTPPASGNGRYVFTSLGQFTTKPDISGQNPVGAPVLGTGGTIYGVASQGGVHQAGEAFAVP